MKGGVCSIEAKLKEISRRLPRRRSDTLDAAFDIAKAKELAEMLEWSARPELERPGGVTPPLQLIGRYLLAWRDHTALGGAAGVFRYLRMPVPPLSTTAN